MSVFRLYPKYDEPYLLVGRIYGREQEVHQELFQKLISGLQEKFSEISIGVAYDSAGFYTPGSRNPAGYYIGM